MAKVLKINKHRKLSRKEIAEKVWNEYKANPKPISSTYVRDQYGLSTGQAYNVHNKIRLLAGKENQQWVGRTGRDGGFATQEYWETLPPQTDQDPKQEALPFTQTEQPSPTKPDEFTIRDLPLVQEAYYNHIRKFWDDLRETRRN